MSFHRRGGPIPKKKSSARRRPIWDDSVHDLTVFKATPDEVLMRKESHKSKNHMSVKLEQMRKENEKRKMTGAEAQQLAIMKEVLYDQQQLQKVMAKSDKMMAVVKDLFGDDPKRFTGFPNVTTAPKSSSAADSLVAPVPDIYTRTEKMSDSVMSASALNDVNTSDSDEDDEVDQPDPISYESKLNLLKFQQFLQEEEHKLNHHDVQTLVAQQNQNASNNKRLNSARSSEEVPSNMPSNFLQIISKSLSDKELELKTGLLSQDPHLLNTLMTALADVKNDGFKTPPKGQQGDPRLPSEQTPPSAINDTKRVKKTKKRIPSPPAHNVAASANSSMADMRKALQDLGKELHSFERQMGHHHPEEEKDKSETFSGYTVALVSAVSRLTRYLKETELRLRTEVTLREQLTEDVFQLRTIIDALATDIIMTQEEYAKLYSENQRYRETTTNIILGMRNEMQEMRKLITEQTSGEITKENAENTPRNTDNLGDQNRFHVTASSPLQSEQGQPPKSTFPNSSSAKTQLIASDKSTNGGKSLPTTAVMLSPPVRKTRIARETHGTRNVSDPALITQVPSAMESISVPRPTPLVQSNLPIDLATLVPQSGTEDLPNGFPKNSAAQSLHELVKLGDQTHEQLNSLQEMAVEEALNNPALQDLMQTQIAELNRQQEEARKRLQDLLSNQKFQQQHLQEQLGANILSEGDLSSSPKFYQRTSQNQVSPPISPISQGSERTTTTMKDRENIPQIPMGRGISLTLPMVDLDVSTGSLTSPPPAPLTMTSHH